jgi:hypothetical protein
MRAFVASICMFALLGCTAEDEPEKPYEYVDELEATQSLDSVRFAHAATLLDDGRVMLVGGIRGAPSQLDFEAFVTEVELFDPISERFEQGAALASGRSWPSATRIADGRVVVLGGTTLNESTLSAPALAIEVWDPVTEAFSTVGELPAAGVLFHCAAPLGSEVLVIDECFPGSCAPLRVSASAGPSTLGGDPTYRYAIDVDCAPLPDGRVLLAGGIEIVDLVDVPSAYVEIYDPASESFELVGPMSAAYGPKSELLTLDTGDVLILGDAVDGAVLGQIYSPSSGGFTPLTGDIADRVDHTLTLLGDGRVLIVGGTLADSPDLDLAPGLDLFDPTDNSLLSLDQTFASRKGHTAVRLDQGPVLIAGGQDAADFRSDALLFR